MTTTLALLLSLSPSLALAQLWCPRGDTHLERDASGVTSITASGCRDVAVQAHFLGSRGSFRTALAFDNPALPLALGCSLGSSCLKYTQDCRSRQWVHGTYVDACKGDPLADPTEISCACQAPTFTEFKGRVPAGKTVPLKPAFLVDSTGDDRIDSRMTDELRTGGGNFRIYELFRTLSRWEIEDYHVGPAGDFNDYLAAVETRDCEPNVVFPPHTTDFGGAERAIGCVDACGSNPCEKPLVAPQQPLRFSVALGIDDTNAESDREWRGRKMHLTVAMHSDHPGEALAVCPVLWLDWQRPRDQREVDDLTQFINYGGDSECGTGKATIATTVPLCPSQDRAILEEALPISLSATGVTTQCGQQPTFDEEIRASLAPSNSCGARTLVRDYELPVAAIDRGLVDSSLHYRNASTADLTRAVVRVDLMVFRQLDTRAWTLNYPMGLYFACPSGINALLKGAPSTVAQVTRYRFNPPTRPNPTPGFTVYVRQ